MSDLEALIERAKAYRPSKLAARAKVSRYTLHTITTGQHTNVMAHTVKKLNDAMDEIDLESTKIKHSKKTAPAKRQTKATRGTRKAA